VTFTQTAIRPYSICQIRTRICTRFSESVYSVRKPKSGFANPANSVLTWIY